LEEAPVARPMEEQEVTANPMNIKITIILIFIMDLNFTNLDIILEFQKPNARN
jgi:hypothetical protein